MKLRLSYHTADTKNRKTHKSLSGIETEDGSHSLGISGQAGKPINPDRGLKRR
ncbi:MULTISPECIES: hypothetical protein [unclassified Microcoleus]|uniref:hypothetical protein n=1 Tax=unclassified Microcoleus TaxID=2642155 RepID=UPI0025FFCAE6|nr:MULTISPECIES: hypothetical protein [unclassified Microcoleus]